MGRATATVLVAEPDRLQLQLIDMLLASGDFELIMVESGRAALEVLQDVTPDLAMLAMDLPDLTGDVICGKIRRVTRLSRTPVILVAPQAGRFGLSDEARSRARKAGADLVLPRPLGDKNLRERIQALVDMRDDTPERSALTTSVIEDALRDLDEPPVGRSASAPSAGDEDAQTDGSSVADATNVTAVTDATDAAADGDTTGDGDAPAAAMSSGVPSGVPSPASATTADAVFADIAAGAASSGTPEALHHELATLRLENRQLKRKLAEAKSALAAGVDPEMKRRIEELERRNRGLLATLEERKTNDRGGGLFGRKR